MWRCPNCRRPVDRDDTVCDFCGDSLTGQTKRSDIDKGRHSAHSNPPVASSPRQGTSPQQLTREQSPQQSLQVEAQHGQHPSQQERSLHGGGDENRHPNDNVGGVNARGGSGASRRSFINGGVALIVLLGGGWLLWEEAGDEIVRRLGFEPDLEDCSLMSGRDSFQRMETPGSGTLSFEVETEHDDDIRATTRAHKPGRVDVYARPVTVEDGGPESFETDVKSTESHYSIYTLGASGSEVCIKMWYDQD